VNVEFPGLRSVNMLPKQIRWETTTTAKTNPSAGTTPDAGIPEVAGAPEVSTRAANFIRARSGSSGRPRSLWSSSSSSSTPRGAGQADLAPPSRASSNAPRAESWSSPAGACARAECSKLRAPVEKVPREVVPLASRGRRRAERGRPGRDDHADGSGSLAASAVDAGAHSLAKSPRHGVLAAGGDDAAGVGAHSLGRRAGGGGDDADRELWNRSSCGAGARSSLSGRFLRGQHWQRHGLRDARGATA